MNIFVPALVLGIYTMLFFIYLGLARRKAVLDGEIDPRYFRTFSGGEQSVQLRLLSRHAANLLEMPTLFYAAVLMIQASGLGSTMFVGLAWSYVVLRFAHAFIHLGTNYVLHRFLVFGASTIVLLLMWSLLLARFVLSQEPHT